MDYVISSSALNNAVKKLTKVISKKAALPILSNLLFKVEGNHMEISSSDGEVLLSIRLELEKNYEAYSFCVDAKQLKEALKVLPAQPITLSVNSSDKTFILKHQDGFFYFPIYDANEYPSDYYKDDATETITINGKNVSEGIKHCLFALADDELRPAMCGVCFDFTENGLTIVGSDGHCLVKSEMLTELEINSKFVMQKKAAKLFVEQKSEDNIIIKYGPKWVAVEAGYTTIKSRLIDCIYPKYNSVIPTVFESTVEIGRSNLISALKAILPFSPDYQRGKVIFNFSENKLEISTDDFDTFSGATIKIGIVYNGENVSLGLNGKVLINGLNELSDTAIEFKFNDPNKAFIIEDLYKDANSNQISFLMMPIYLD